MIKPWTGTLVNFIQLSFIITAVSNGANMTDGLDGLATGTSAIIRSFGCFAYVSGNTRLSQHHVYTQTPVNWLCLLGHLLVLVLAFYGITLTQHQVLWATLAALHWGYIAVLHWQFIKIIDTSNLWVFLVEKFISGEPDGLFQIHQKKKEVWRGKRVFLMAPLHHHFQKRISRIKNSFKVLDSRRNARYSSIVTLKLRIKKESTLSRVEMDNRLKKRIKGLNKTLK